MIFFCLGFTCFTFNDLQFHPLLKMAKLECFSSVRIKFHFIYITHFPYPVDRHLAIFHFFATVIWVAINIKWVKVSLSHGDFTFRFILGVIQLDCVVYTIIDFFLLLFSVLSLLFSITFILFWTPLGLPLWMSESSRTCVIGYSF